MPLVAFPGGIASSQRRYDPAVGVYSYLSVGGYDILSTKGGFVREALSIFDDDDRVRDDWGIHYRASIGVVRDRLETMGFSLAHSQSVLLGAAAARARELSEDGVHPDYEDERQVCERLTFEDWLAAFRDLKVNGIHSWNRSDVGLEVGGLDPAVVEEVLRRDPSLFDYLLDTLYGTERFGYPEGDFRVLLRGAIEAGDDDEVVEYELSELGGYYTLEDLSPTAARDSLIADFPSNAPILVLTEGPTDIAAIESAMRVLVPHLRSYYSFLDFSAAAARGGATALMEVVKAFAGARLVNRVVAIFDNDAVGRDAVRVLSRGSLPANIRVVLLPPLAAAESYPTIGPSGPSIDNINGRAASLELYFGFDVLSDPGSGALAPVRWAGFVARTRAGRRRRDGRRRGASGLRTAPAPEAAGETAIPLRVREKCLNERRCPAVVRKRQNAHEFALA